MFYILQYNSHIWVVKVYNQDVQGGYRRHFEKTRLFEKTQGKTRVLLGFFKKVGFFPNPAAL